MGSLELRRTALVSGTGLREAKPMADRRDLTRGSVCIQLVRLASPLSIGIIAMFSATLVDAYFLGQLGTQPLAAISYAFPVAFAIMSLAIGLAAGTGSLLSRAIGKGDRSRIVSLTTHSLVLAAITGVVVACIGTMTIRPLFLLIGAEGGVLDDIVAYMRIWYCALPLLVLSQVGASILRANGDSLVPSALMVATAVVGIALDPILIFGGFGIEAMGMEGAAWANFCARTVMPLVIIPVLLFRDRLINLKRTSWDEVLSSWREIGRIGIAAALGNAVNPAAIGVATAIVAVYGDQVVAGFGVAGRLESFAVVPMLALSGSIGPLAGQNWGAKKYERIRSAIRFSFLACFAWSAIVAIGFWVGAGWLAGQFSDSPIVVEEVSWYLWIVPITFAGYGVTIVAAGAFNALGRPMLGLGLYLVRSLLFYIPITLVATQFFDTTGVYAGIAIANLLAGLVILWLSLRWLNGMIERERQLG
ncbi:MATE family efflux transporter [Parasphingopyxis lamellibrachiae]|uniref:Putative MATE family efflux protein n=1 Tax=Parasphingopyxis lamellibrachiae TaxID=680125 RepID=A0A3D9FCI6_9SPHN|nr:MATE family efflux transporter [Parasphingopyxis lamellibrachiae]RED15514.1 putative MATE family efflux protein [Parasphingopyxis lamellibrachiae]